MKKEDKRIYFELMDNIEKLNPGDRYIFHRNHIKLAKRIINYNDKDYRFVLEPEDNMRIERKIE